MTMVIRISNVSCITMLLWTVFFVLACFVRKIRSKIFFYRHISYFMETKCIFQFLDLMYIFY